MIKVEMLGDLPGIRHGFLTRTGGGGDGIYASLNCGAGSKELLDHVLENRARAVAFIGMPEESLATAYQGHNAKAIIVDRVWPGEAATQADGPGTDRPGTPPGD